MKLKMVIRVGTYAYTFSSRYGDLSKLCKQYTWISDVHIFKWFEKSKRSDENYKPKNILNSRKIRTHWRQYCWSKERYHWIKIINWDPNLTGSNLCWQTIEIRVHAWYLLNAATYAKFSSIVLFKLVTLSLKILKYS